MAFRVSKPSAALRLGMQVERFRVKAERLGLPREAVAEYEKRAGEMLTLEDAAKAAADRIGRIPVTRRFRLVSFARKLYGAHRRLLLPPSGSVLSGALPQTRY
jgi:hypothetical protein